MSAISLFSGVEGLGLAVADVFGAHPVAFAEYEKNPSKVLAARYPDVPNVGDVTTADWSAYGDVDVIHGGPPCQPFSAAGRREGMADERWMWPAMERAVRMVRPRYVVVENVPPLVASDAWGVIVSDLAALGYVGSWLCLRASDVGACHRRERVFLLAHAGSRESGPADGRDLLGRWAHDAEQAGMGGGHPAPHTDHAGRSEHGRTVADRAQHPTVERRGAAAADPDDGGLERGGRARDGRSGPADDGAGLAWGDYAHGIARHELALGRPAPAPVDERGRLSARFVEWMQMLPEGWVTNVLPRNPALKALGNAVVPAQGAAALRRLLARVDDRVAA